MKPQFIITPTGEELAVIPRAEYEDLLVRAGLADPADVDEDAADVALYDERKADLATGVSAALSPEVSTLMLHGASLPRAIRKWRGLSQQAVAAKVGTAQGFISDIESGRRRAAAITVTKLAEIYDVPAEWLMEAIGPK